MEETRFYPLVDTDNSGKHKAPMFFSSSESTVRNNHDFYLKEMVSGYYRLCSKEPLTAKTVNSLSIDCPYCGKMMKAITKFTNAQGTLYCCPMCNPKKNV